MHFLRILVGSGSRSHILDGVEFSGLPNCVCFSAVLCFA